MTVVRGRSRTGAGSLLRALTCTALAVIGLETGGCGSTTVNYGTAVVTLSATPGPFTSYFVSVYEVTLTRTDGTIAAPVSVPERVDLTQLSDVSELLGAPAVPEGTYISAAISLDYGAQATPVISIDVNGTSQTATVVDDSGNAAGIVTYSLKFDSAHPLVITHNVSTHIDLNVDLSASTNILSTSPAKVAVKPFATLSTVPSDTRPIRARGVFVVANPAGGTFTMNARPLFDDRSGPFGALTMKPSAQTLFNVNGQLLSGSAALTAIQGLPVYATIAAYGTLGDMSTITPVFQPTTVYAGTSLESTLGDNAYGTVAARTSTTLTLKDATVFTRAGFLGFASYTVPVTISSSTSVSQDGSTATNLTGQSISIGQHVFVVGQVTADSTGAIITGVDATSGLVRLNVTPLWGTLNPGATPGTAYINVSTLSNYEPSVFTFTGTGSTLDANPANYQVNTGSVDLSGVALTPTPPLFRFDGVVTPFGSAPPDFTALTVTAATATDSVLAVNWSPGATAPFSTQNATELIANLANTSVHTIRTGPSSLDMTTIAAVTIVPDSTVTLQLAIGSPGTSLSVFHDFASFYSQITTTLNGTNMLERLVAVGHYDSASNTFTAKRIDLLQQ